MEKDNKMIVAILVAAALITAGLVFVALQSSCSPDSLKAAVIEGVDAYVNGEKPESVDEPVEVSGGGVDDGIDPILGDPNAPITIFEYSEYECSYCERFYSGAYQELKTEYIDKGLVKLVFMDFPLSFHQNAYPAALAAECVQDQLGDEGYFEMHNLIFDNQGDLSAGNLKTHALSLGVNEDGFDQCVAGNMHRNEIANDMKSGEAAGISGTPSFLIDGQLLVGAQPFSVFKEIIDAKL